MVTESSVGIGYYISRIAMRLCVSRNDYRSVFKKDSLVEYFQYDGFTVLRGFA